MDLSGLRVLLVTMKKCWCRELLKRDKGSNLLSCLRGKKMLEGEVEEWKLKCIMFERWQV